MTVAPRRLVVGVDGAQGIRYALALLDRLGGCGVESHLVPGDACSSVLHAETGLSLQALRSRVTALYHERNQAAAISSGSFLTLGMVVVPCAMRSLAAIVTGVGENLLQRAADVTMKEGRRLVLALPEPGRDGPGPIGRENQRRAEWLGIRVLTLPPAVEPGQVDEILACFGLAEAWDPPPAPDSTTLASSALPPASPDGDTHGRRAARDV